MTNTDEQWAIEKAIEIIPGGIYRAEGYRREIVYALREAIKRGGPQWFPIKQVPLRKSVMVGKVGTELMVQAYVPNPASGLRHMHSGDPICFEPTHYAALPTPPREEVK